MSTYWTFWEMSMLTGVQIRMARSAVGWSAEYLACECGIASKTVRRLEAQDGSLSTTSKSVARIKSALEAAGIEFIGTPANGPGIRIHAK